VYYTRSGSFQKDQEGYLVNNAGLRLQGRRLNEDGSLSGEQPGDINLHYSSVGPLLHKAGKATDVVHLSANLSSMTTPEEAVTYEPNNPNSYDYAVTVHVYDSRGTGHNVDVHFRREPVVEGSTTATWSWYVVAPATEVETSETGALVNVLGGQTKGGTLTFDQDGRLVSDALDPKVADSVKMTFLGTGGQPTTEQTIQFDFGTSRAEDPENASAGRSGTVQLASDSSIFNLAQNGYGIGYLEEINISEDGNIYGSYSNGQVQAMYQIALVDFADEQGLDQVGANLYVETNASGVAQVNRAQSGRLGSIRAFTLEQSNVDMASEFVTMIAMQRAFQANSRIVSVTDGMLEELLSLKR
jgi:flagellar hook protein FlgE